MRIQVIANCQARPISSLIALMLPGAEVLEPIILHLARAPEAEAHLNQIDSADVVLTQLTAENFSPEHLSTRALKTRFGDRAVGWPNIFYSGQQPYLRYFTHPEHGRLLGPMEAMHDIRLHESWLRTGRANPDVLGHHDPDFVAKVRAASLAALRRREAQCDVAISDFIAEHEDRERLFFTFNHPTRLVLAEMLRRLLTHVGETATAPPEGREFLGRYQVPSLWPSGQAGFQGDGIEVSDSGTVQRQPGAPVAYDANTLCHRFSEVYDAWNIFRTMENVRRTPEYAV